MVAQHQIGLAVQRQLQRLRGHVGVAVAVAAAPLAHAQEGRHVLIVQAFFEVAVDARDLRQEGGLVIAQCVFDFVGHGELGETQQARLPELRHAGAQLGFEVGVLARQQLLTFGQQVGDGALGIQNALALHLGGVRGEHRRDVGRSQRAHHVGRRDAGLFQSLQRQGQAALLQIASAVVHRATADVVAVFGQVGQVAEVGESADHAHRLLAREAFEQLLQRLVGVLVGVAAEGHRKLADLLDQVVGSLAFLLPDHVTQHTSQQADVIDQGLVFVGAGLGTSGTWAVGRGGGSGRRSAHGGQGCSGAWVADFLGRGHASIQSCLSRYQAGTKTLPAQAGRLIFF
ncbi:hypothetical protein FQZ97_865320 [compost metagenome]